MSRTLHTLAAAIAALILTACGGEGGDDYAAQLRGQAAQLAAQSAPATSTTAPTATPEPTAIPTATAAPTIEPASLAVIPTPEPLPTTTPYVVPTYTPAPAVGAPIAAPIVNVVIADDGPAVNCKLYDGNVVVCKEVKP